MLSWIDVKAVFIVQGFCGELSNSPIGNNFNQMITRQKKTPIFTACGRFNRLSFESSYDNFGILHGVSIAIANDAFDANMNHFQVFDHALFVQCPFVGQFSWMRKFHARQLQGDFEGICINIVEVLHGTCDQTNSFIQ